MILTRLEDDTIRVNVLPRKLNESENDALTTPLSVAGTAEDLDAQLPSSLVQFVGAHLELRNTLQTAKDQMAAAAKTAKAEARSKVAPKTAPVQTEPAAAETKKPVDAAPKPAEPRKQDPARNASLFDIGPATAAQLPISDADEEEEILAEAAEDEATDESDDFDEAA
jgi:PRTRC genetic system protein E